MKRTDETKPARVLPFPDRMTTPEGRRFNAVLKGWAIVYQLSDAGP